MSHFLFDRCRSHWNHPVSALHIHQVSCWFQNLLEKIVWEKIIWQKILKFNMIYMF
jgi:hypothetical protein